MRGRVGWVAVVVWAGCEAPWSDDTERLGVGTTVGGSDPDDPDDGDDDDDDDDTSSGETAGTSTATTGTGTSSTGTSTTGTSTTGTTTTADCVVALPADTVVVHGTATEPVPGTSVWVCAGGSVDALGPDDLVVVESGGSAYVPGPDSDVYVRAGGYAELTGPDAVAYVEDPQDVDFVQGVVDVERCTAIAVDASAVANGC